MDINSMKDEHPGHMIAHALRREGLSVEEAATLLDMKRANLSPILNGRKGLGPRLALRIESCFDIDAGDLVCQQARYDLSKIRENLA